MNNTMSWVILVVVVVGFIFLYYQIPETPEIPTYDIPTAADIATKIVIPVPEVPEMPKMPVTRLSLRQELKENAIDVCDDEFDMSDVEDLFGDDDEVRLVREYTDQREYSSISLGIDNEDDREITVERVYKVEVIPDLDDDYKDKVYVECEVTSDDGELEANIEYSL